jgi:hypothetical protein
MADKEQKAEEEHNVPLLPQLMLCCLQWAGFMVAWQSFQLCQEMAYVTEASAAGAPSPTPAQLGAFRHC